MVLVLTSKLTWPLCGWSRKTSFQCGGSELTWFQCTEQNGLAFVRGSKKSWFRVWTEIKYGFLTKGVESNPFLEWGSKWLDTSVKVEITLAFVRGIEIDMVLVWGSTLTCFLCRGQNRPGFFVRPKTTCFQCWLSKIELVFNVRAGHRLVLVWSSKLLVFV